MQYRRGAALFPFADAIVEPQQMSKALWVLEGRPLALGALRKGERKGGHRSGPSSRQRALVPEEMSTGGGQNPEDLFPFINPVVSQDLRIGGNTATSVPPPS